MRYNIGVEAESSIALFDLSRLPSSVQRLAALAPPCLSGFVPRAEPTPRLSSWRYRGSNISQNGSSCTQSSGLCPNVEGWRQGGSIKWNMCLFPPPLRILWSRQLASLSSLVSMLTSRHVDSSRRWLGRLLLSESHWCASENFRVVIPIKCIQFIVWRLNR